MTCGHLEDFRQVPMQIVHILRRRPEREFAVMTELSETCMLFESEVSAAFVEGNIFADMVGFGKPCFHTAEFVNLSSMDIA